jgi:hypothetical protein
MSEPTKFGREFLVNTNTIGSAPATASLAGGGFVILWKEASPPGGETSAIALRGQVFNADGWRLGAEFLVAEAMAAALDINAPDNHAVAGLANGRFIVVWAGVTGDTSRNAVRGQFFNADGTAFGSQFQVNTTVSGVPTKPAATSFANGCFAVVWADTSQVGGTASWSVVRGQLFNADGTRFGFEFLVNSTMEGFRRDPAIAALSDGSFVAVWTDISVEGEWNIRGQRFSASGNRVGGEFMVNTTVAGRQEHPAVPALAGGRFVVTWTDSSRTGADTLQTAVRGQMFKADGSKAGAEFLVNTVAQGFQLSPAAASLADSRFVVMWSDVTLTATGSDIGGQLFKPDGSKSGEVFVANTAGGNQLNPAIAVLANGRFVVAWTDTRQPGAVRGQQFTV